MADDKPPLDKDVDLVARAIEELPYVTGAYQALANRYYGLLMRYCYGILRDRSEAEDACQVILLKVYHGLPRFQWRSSFKTWLLKVAANTCYSRRLKLKRERERFSPLDNEMLENTAGANTAETRVFHGDRFETLVDSLSDQEQILLNLRFVGDQSFDQIAEIMGLGLSATKMRYYRALRKLELELG